MAAKCLQYDVPQNVFRRVRSCVSVGLDYVDFDPVTVDFEKSYVIAAIAVLVFFPAAEVKIEFADEAVKVYNFQAEGFHTYHVGRAGVLVHNATNYPSGKSVKGAAEIESGSGANGIYEKICTY